MLPLSRWRHGPLALALVLLAALAASVLRALLARTGGHLVYVLDDGYIDMAIARNLVGHGLWGTTRFGFSPAASSPIWVLILAASYLLAGISAVAPLVLTLAAAVSFLVVAARTLRPFDVSPVASALLLAVLVVFVPLVPLALCGLEHPLQAAAALAFVAGMAQADPDLRRPRQTAALAALAALAVAVRYEGLFLVFAATLPLIARRRFAPAAAIAAGAAVPVVVYAVFSLAHGAAILPSSLLLKGNLPDLSATGLRTFLSHPLQSLHDAPHMLVVLISGAGVLALAARAGQSAGPAARMMRIVMLAALFHLALARVNFFYRYEAYLLALWLVALGANLSTIEAELARIVRGRRLERVALAAILGLGAVPFAVRALRAHLDAPNAARDIYEQQVQMGLFLRDFYPGARVAANDIGAINFLADVDNLDLAGLGTMEVTRALRHGRFDTGTIAALAGGRRMQIAILYEVRYASAGGLPRAWRKVGEWSLPDTTVVDQPAVAFYAVDPREVGRLAASLRSFAPRLPPRVRQRLSAEAEGARLTDVR